MKLQLTMISLLGMTLAADAARIVWVTDNGTEGFGTGSDGAVRGAFYADPVSPGTPYTDQAFITLLQGAGHTVERFNPTANAISVDDIKLLNAYDLVIVGSATNSGPFNIQARGNNAKGWNTMITKPMIVTKSTLIRRDRMGWLRDNREYDCGANTLANPVTATGKLTFVNPAHPVFNTIASTPVGASQVMNNFCNIIIPDPLNNRGTSMQYFNLTVAGADPGAPANGSENLMEPGGVLLASMNFHPMNPGVNIAAGILPTADPTYNATGYSIVEWPAFSTVRTTSGQDSGPDRLAGYRMHFACGTRDATGSATGAPNPVVGAMDLSADGQTMFRNAVAHAIAQPTGMPTGVNTWRNTSSDGLWNETSVNWSTSIWLGGDALFGPTGEGPVSIASPGIAASGMEFTASNYIISATGGNSLTLAGTDPDITVADMANLSVTIEGSGGLIKRGSGTLILSGDTTSGFANRYTGGTQVQAGTLVLKALFNPTPPITGGNYNPVAISNGTYAVDSIDAIDTGATVKLFNDLDTVTTPGSPVNVRVPNGQINNRKRLNLTGGTLDLAGDDNLNNVPAPEGVGLITNSSPHARAALRMGADSGVTRTFSGVMADGGPVTQSSVKNADGTFKQGYRLDIDLQGFADDTATFVIAGLNTYTGFTRIGGGKLTFSGNGRWGVPTNTGVPLTSSPNGTIICNGGITNLRVDFNGTSQITGGLNGNGGIFANNKPNSVSTLTVGAADISNSVWPSAGGGQTGKIVDNTTGTGGTVALTKVGTGKIGLPTALNTYSGPTTIQNGILEYTATGAPSPNSEIKITGAGQLSLLYTGTKIVPALYLNGVRQAGGVYGALGSAAPVIGIAAITGTGTITVAVPGQWSNLSGDSLWNDSSANWTFPSVWAGGDAFFTATGVGTVTVASPVTASNLTFSAPGYTINSTGGVPLNLAGATPTVTATADATIAASISGTDGVTYRGPGTTTLEGDSSASLGNTYTGGTFIRSGTVVMKVGLPAASITNRFAMGDIEALDAGATLKYYNALDTAVVPNVNIRTPNGQLNISNKFNITGGTFDLAGDNNQNTMPTPNGTGFITNSSPHERAVLKIHGDSGKTFEFSGIISDGGPVVESPISGRVGFRTDVDMASGDSTLIISGPNTFSGSFRRGTGRLKLEGAGRLGNVTTRTPSIGLRINGNAGDTNPDVDLNGTNQRISGIGGNGGKLLNNKAGTSSVLTMGFVAGHVDTVVPGWPGAFVDNNNGSGGVLGISKTGINTQILTGSLHTYSGPTMINEGILQFGTAAAPSPNSDIQINGSAKLDLLYTGTRNVNGLFLNGVRQAPGEYGAEGSVAPVIATAFITGPGTVTVAPVHPSYAAVMTISPSTEANPTLSWTGVGLLQSSSTLGQWTDLPGAASPLQITLGAAQRIYFRIKQ